MCALCASLVTLWDAALQICLISIPLLFSSLEMRALFEVDEATESADVSATQRFFSVNAKSNLSSSNYPMSMPCFIPFAVCLGLEHIQNVPPFLSSFIRTD